MTQTSKYNTHEFTLKYFLCSNVRFSMVKLLKLFFFTFCFYTFFTSCRKESFSTDASHSINVESDTIWFDTVFTKVNSQTPLSVNKQIKIYNPYDESIRTNIRLGGGEQSHFRLNVDGVPGHSFTDIEIFPKDSIFIFLEIHPDPNNNSPDFNPLIIRDSIMYSTNGNDRKTMLIGWGQDAHYIFRDSIEQDTSWSDANLPIVVYGYCYVKPGVKLTIEKGLQIHYAPRSWLFVEGELEVQGTKDEPVLMQGDRLQPDWEERSGQWGGIWFNWPTYGNRIEHAIIKNGTVGIYCDTIPGDPSSENVTISKTMVRNMTFDGIAGRGSRIVVQNSVAANCGRYTFLGSQGGDYYVRNSTFYTGRGSFIRNNPTFGFTNRTRDEFGRITAVYPIRYDFRNNIVDGVFSDGEFVGDVDTSASVLGQPSLIENNLLKTIEINVYSGNGNILNADPLFLDIDNFNFDIDSVSPAKDKGQELSPRVVDDFCDRPRIVPIDIGAFEVQ